MNRIDHPNHPAPIQQPFPARVRSARSIPASLVRAYAAANAHWRAAVLDRLVRSVGTLALAVIGGGVFVKFLSGSHSVSIEDAAHVTAGQLYELACYVQQAQPGLLEQILASLQSIA